MIVTLASRSPRRRELIKKIDGLTVNVTESGVEENATASSPELLVQQLAFIKAKAVYERDGGIVIGADTIVAIDGQVLGKPKTVDEADGFFRLLCGKTHQVYTGLAVISDKREITTVECTNVTFAPYDSETVQKYIASGSPFDKAGGYGIQDEMLKPMIESVEGDLDNVIGLPVELLRKTRQENEW